MTLNELIAVASRAAQLADKPIDALRALFPVATANKHELVNYCADRRLSRGQLIYSILCNEFETSCDLTELT